MAACLYSLATNPEVQEKLRREVQDVVGEEEVVTPQHIQDMHYLRDTIKETMRWELGLILRDHDFMNFFSLRLYPIAPNNSRMMKEDVVLSGYKIPAKVSQRTRHFSCSSFPSPPTRQLLSCPP